MTEVSPLLQALYRRDDDEVARLRASVASLDVFEAAALGDVERLDTLLEDEPELVDAWSPDGFRPLHLAAFFRRPEAARLLLERGAEADGASRNDMRVTPLHSAAASAQVEIARMLLDRAADANARQSGGFTPIHAAAQNGDDAMLALLLEHGADVGALADNGRSAAEFAAEAGHDELAQRLRESSV